MANETFQLIMQKGGPPGQTFTIEVDDLIIGRDPLADIVLEEPNISRHHARLIRRGETLELHDLGSTNGSFVDGKRLATEPVLLESGQLIQLGSNVVLSFQHIPAEDPNATRLSARDDDVDGTVIVRREPASQSDETADLPPFDPRKNPYVGPRAFEPNEREFFYGRDDEIAILQGQVMSRRASLFFAQSGAGKSSLLRAGLIPELTRIQKIGRGRRAHTYQRMGVLPILSVGGGIPAGMTAPIDNVFVFSAIYSLYPDANPDEVANLSISEGLAGFFGGAPAGAKEGSTIVPVAVRTADDSGGATLLIFDQFEELFHVFSERWRDREAFFRQVSQALADYPDLHVLFTMREDYIAELTPYANLLPDQLRARFRLERLKREAAMSAVRAPAEKAGRTFSEGVAESLVDNLRRSQTGKKTPGGQMAGAIELGEYVEPVHLQIVCRQLWENLPAKRRIIEQADVQEFGDVDQALIGFYEATLSQVCVYGDLSQRRLRTWFDEELITPARTRGLVYRGDQETEGLSNDAVEILNDAYIIRASVRGGDIWYELAHDRLVEPILGANQAWRVNYDNPLDKATQAWLAAGRDPQRLLDGAQLVEAQTYAKNNPGDVLVEEKEFLEESHRREISKAEEDRVAARRRRLTIIAALAVVVILCIATSFSIFQAFRASRQAVIADEAAAQAEIAAEQARAAEDLAHEQQLIAQGEAQRAEDEAQNALEAQEVAEFERVAADAERVKAELLSRRSLAESMAANALNEASQDVPDPSLALILARESALMTRDADGFVLDNSRNALLAAVTSAPPWKMNLPRSQHTGPVNSSQFSPDGQRVVSASNDGLAKIWDVATGEDLLSLIGHGAKVNSAIYSPDGTRIVTASEDGLAIVWDAENGEILLVLVGHENVVRLATFSPDGSTIATAGWDETAKVWDAESGEEILTLTGHVGFVNSVNFSPDGSRIVTVGDDGARVWDAGSGQPLFSLERPETIFSYAMFDPTDQIIVTTDWDGGVVLWDAESGEMLSVLEGHTAAVPMADFNSDGSVLITAGWDELLIEWNVATGEATGFELLHPAGINSIDIDPQDRAFVSTDDAGRQIIWSFETFEELLTLGGHSSQLIAGAFSPDSESVITNGKDGTIRVWDAVTGRELSAIEPEFKPYQFALSPDGSRLAIGGYEGQVSILDFQNGESLFQRVGHESAVNSVAYSRNGERIVSTGTDGKILVWDAESGEELLALADAHDGFSVSVAKFSPDDSRLLTAAEEKGIRVWDIETTEILFEIPYFGILDANYDSRGERFVTAGTDRSAQVWDAESGENLTSLVGHRNWVQTAVFSPNGQQIVTSSDDTTAIVWDAQTGEELLALPGHQNWLTSAAYDPSGQWIVTTSKDGTAKIWEPEAPRSAPVLENSGDPLTKALFSADGQRILTADQAGAFKIWDTQSGEELTAESDVWLFDASPIDAQFVTLGPEGLWIRDVNNYTGQQKLESFDANGNEVEYSGTEYSPNGNFVTAKVEDTSLVIFDLIGGEAISHLEGHSAWMNDSEMSPDGSLVATAGCDQIDSDSFCTSGSVKVWETASGDLRLEQPYESEVTGVSFSPNGEMVAAAIGYNSASLWNIMSDEIVIDDILHSVSSPPLFSPDGKSLLLVNGFQAYVWDIEFQFSRAELIGHFDNITHIAYSPDGENIITSNWDGTARVWDAETGIEKLLVDAHRGQVWWADFSPDGDLIVTASEDGTAIIWPYSIDRLLYMVEPLVQRATPALTPQEIVRLGLFVE